MNANDYSAAVNEQWAVLLSDADQHVRKIATLASQEPELRRLFPFASLSNVRFSRTTSYPFDFDLPFILTTPAGSYEARDGDNSPLGSGDLPGVIKLVVEALKRRGLR